MKIKKINQGFTLIELLVVIAIISILASILMVAIDPLRQISKANDAVRLSDMNNIQRALEMYYFDNNHYPIGSWAFSDEASWNQLQNKLLPYLSKLPKDPKNSGGHPYSGGYTYGYFSAGYGGPGQWYMLILHLENSPQEMEQKDGVKACDGTNFHYGNNHNGVLTVGGSCKS